MSIARFYLIVTAILAATPAEASSICEELRHISATDHAVSRQINNRTLPRPSAAYDHLYRQANAVINANHWPFTFSETQGGDYTFKPADFDGDGRIDKMTSSCGASVWDRICTLILDRGQGQPLTLEAGWMYLSHIHGHFYAVWDYYGPETSEGSKGVYPKKDFSRYFRVTSHGFPEICKAGHRR